MASDSTNMVLRLWDQLADKFNHSELVQNWNKVDAHDHTAGKGVTIPAGGLQTAAVTNVKIADGAVTNSKLADGSVQAAKLATGGVGTTQLADASVTTVKLANTSVTSAKMAVGLLPTRVSTLPASPTDGYEIYYAADATNAIIWHLRYNSGSASAYKWEFVGGGSLFSYMEAVATLGTTSAWTNYSDTGPTITLPLAGDYEIDIGAAVSHSGTNQGVFIGAQATNLSPTTSDSAVFNQPTSTGGATVSIGRTYRAAGISGTLRQQYWVGATGGGSSRRFIRARPVRVG